MIMTITIICTGWSDTEGASDQHTFKDLLRHLQKEQLTCIKVTAMIIIMMIIVGRAFWSWSAFDSNDKVNDSRQFYGLLCRPQGWTRCYNNRPSKLLKRMSSTNVQCLHVSYCLKSSTGEILTISICQVHRIVHNQYINMFTMSIYQYIHDVNMFTMSICSQSMSGS